MRKKEATTILKKSKNNGIFDKETSSKIKENINTLLEEEIKEEKNKIKKIIREQFDGNYDLAQEFCREQLSY